MIRVVIADVDGTLVTPAKELTEGTRRAVIALRAAGVAFAITSGRPPRGMGMLAGPLGLTTPMAAFNGGMLVHPDLSRLDTRGTQERGQSGVELLVDSPGRRSTVLRIDAGSPLGYQQPLGPLDMGVAWSPHRSGPPVSCRVASADAAGFTQSRSARRPQDRAGAGDLVLRWPRARRAQAA
ncbi:MAG TPA: HAD hydrolase family protein [Polyangia bacterium]|nr:HAD hydrolase family protein [Polyangia bacterium]